MTGAAGNLGSNVCRALIDGGERVRALVLHGDPAAARVPGQAEICYGDVLDVASLEAFFGVPDDVEVYVIHAASIVSLDPDYRQKVQDVNVTGTQNVIDQCVRHRVRKLVYVSSTSAIPEAPDAEPIVEVSHFDPDLVMGHYAKTKAQASQLVMDAVRTCDLDASIVFPTGIFGPYDYGFGLITSNVINMVESRIPCGVAGTFNCADVRDLAAGVYACCDRGRKGEGYIMGNETITMRDLFDAIAGASGCRRVTTILPIWLARVLATVLGAVARIARRPAVLTEFTLHNLTRNNNYRSEKAVRELDYRFRPFSDTIRDEVLWLRAEGRI